MKIDVFFPALGQPELVERSFAAAMQNAHGDTGGWIIDNGTEIPLSKSCDINPIAFLRNHHNQGMPLSLDQAKRTSIADILVFLHTDFIIHEEAWDLQLARHFEVDPKLGLVGAVGAQQADSNGGRSNVWCSFRDAEVHGNRVPIGALVPAVLLDGAFMAFRRTAMDAAGIPELPFPRHHFHDKHWSMQMVNAAYSVGVMQMDSEHLGGHTSTRPECQKSFESDGGEQAIYDAAECQYIDRWKEMFPVKVDPFWHYTSRAGPIFCSANQ